MAIALVFNLSLGMFLIKGCTVLLLAFDFRQLIHLNSTFAGFDSRLRPFTRVMGDTYDELDMMLEEPYKAKTGRYDRVSVTLPLDLSYHLTIRIAVI